MSRSPLGSNRYKSYHAKYINQSITSPSWCCRRCRNHNHISDPVPFEEAPALLVQPRRTILSALRTVNLPHHYILLLPRQVPSTEFTSHRLPQPTLPSSFMHPKNSFSLSLPTLCKRMTPSCATTALGVIVSSFSQGKRRTEKMHHDGGKNKTIILGRMLGRDAGLCSLCQRDAEPGYESLACFFFLLAIRC